MRITSLMHSVYPLGETKHTKELEQSKDKLTDINGAKGSTLIHGEVTKVSVTKEN